MLKKAVLAFFSHDRPEVTSVRSNNFNELELVEIGDPSLDRKQGIEKRVFQHPARKAALSARGIIRLVFCAPWPFLRDHHN
jgi:hypothetical protein